MRAGPTVLVVILDGSDEDVPKPQPVREHPGRDQPTAGDREEDVEVLAGQSVRQGQDEVVQVGPRDDVPVDGWIGRVGHPSMIRPSVSPLFSDESHLCGPKYSLTVDPKAPPPDALGLPPADPCDPTVLIG